MIFRRLFRMSIIMLSLVVLVLLLDIGCLIRYLTGFPCPGCGTTRAYILFLQGHIIDAFYFHPLFWLTGLLLTVIVFRHSFFLHAKQTNPRIVWILVSIYFSVYGMRMILLFPHTAPMDYNRNALLYQLYQLVLHYWNS